MKNDTAIMVFISFIQVHDKQWLHSGSIAIEKGSV
jgi:hypothetical protein